MKKRKGSGSAVSIYLPADVKHLHDLAVQDPNLVPSEIYRNALRSILGDHEIKHPLELMKENQEAEVRELSDALVEASKRLEKTTERLPSEIAKSNWLRHNLGETQLAEMEYLRIILFFDSSHPRPFGLEKIKLSSNAEDMLERYKTLVSRYEATKLGPEMTKDFEMIENRHPNELSLPYTKCVSSEDMAIDCHITISSADGKSTSLESDRGIELCDDLQFRCTGCWNTRKNAHLGFKKVGLSKVDVPKLKPYWKTEALTEIQQLAIPKTVKGVGTLQVVSHQIRMNQLEASKARANEIYLLEMPADASRIEELQDLARASYLKDEYGEEIPAYTGHQRWSQYRIKERIQTMKTKYPSNYEEYNSFKQELSSLKEQKSRFIKSKTDELVSVMLENDIESFEDFELNVEVAA